MKTLAEARTTPAAQERGQWLARPLRVQALLRWLHENANSVPEANAEALFRAILEHADVVEYQSLLGQLLSCIPPESRFHTLSNLMVTLSLEQCINLIGYFRDPARNYGSVPPPANYLWGTPDEPLLTAEQLAELRSLILQRIKQAASDDNLEQVRELRLVLGTWYAWEDGDFLNQWGRKQIEQNLVGFFERFARETYIRPGGAGSSPQPHDFSLRPQWFTPFLDPDELMARIRELDRSAKLIKIGAKVVSHGRYVTFQMAEVAVPRQVFQEILSLIARLRAPPAPA